MTAVAMPKQVFVCKLSFHPAQPSPIDELVPAPESSDLAHATSLDMALRLTHEYFTARHGEDVELTYAQHPGHMQHPHQIRHADKWGTTTVTIYRMPLDELHVHPEDLKRQE